MNDASKPKSADRPSARHAELARGFTLMEVMVVLTIIGVVLAMTAPTFQRALEQSRADMAGANLRAIWSAERLYWLDNHTFTNDLTLLESLGLLDPTLVSATTIYVYGVSAADSTTLNATASRAGSTRWGGTFSIDQTGVISGTIEAAGETNIQPGFQ
jgi:prepilin-type N-terminal cleavage/methylation domain-containing protein